MNLVKSVSAAAVAGVTVTLLGATPAEAAVRVRIEQVQYDSPGRDTGTNRSLNAEWVRITNHGTRARHLDDWRLRDRQGHTFRFPDFTLRPGRSVLIHTGRGRDDRNDLYWESNFYIWSNTGDRAKLRNRNGRLTDRCSWGNGDGTTNC